MGSNSVRVLEFETVNSAYFQLQAHGLFSATATSAFFSKILVFRQIVLFKMIL